MRSTFRLTTMLLTGALVAGCGGGGGDGSGEPAAAPEPAPAPEETAADTGGSAGEADGGKQASGPEKWAKAGPSEVVTEENGTTVVHITGNDQMKYNVTEFTVPAGAKVKLILYHVGKQPRSAMGHNVTILEQGNKATAFASKASGEGGTLENGYLPDKLRDRVLATTKLIGGGERTSIEFTAPAPGDYPYLCTFPAHAAAGMKGTMHVEKGE